MLAIPLYDDTPRTGTPVATYGLIAACSLVFLWQVEAGLNSRAGEHIVLALGMIPAVLFGDAELAPGLALVPAWATVATSMFLHGGWVHLIGNMLFLWLFGKGVERALGPTRFLVFYLVCGIIAALTQAAVDPASEVPVVGASGAIAGALGAYAILYPRANVTVFIWILIFVRLVTVPAVILLGLWFLMQLLGALPTETATENVAFVAHIGGFIAGIVLAGIFRPAGVEILHPQRSQPFATVRPGLGPPRRPGGGSVPPVGRRGPWS